MAESTPPLEVRNPVTEPDATLATPPLASADPVATPQLATPQLATPQRVEGVGHILLASLLVALGGMVIPVLGWIAGIALVWVSSTWTQLEKRAAVFTPFAAAAIVAICVSVGRALPDPIRDAAPGDAAGAGTGEFRAPLLNDFTVPFTQELLGSTALVLVVVNFAIGIALLVRALLRRASR